MKIAVLIARILLGLIFVFFGLNGFLNFLHAWCNCWGGFFCFPGSSYPWLWFCWAR
jgi:uncharacterized membrane protein YphA (DoxX/SURF4 family)